MDQRLAKAIEIKTALRDLDIRDDYELYPELEEFSKILNTWVMTDEWFSGYIRVPNLKKKIVYDLNEPKNTIVKLSNLGS